jgi:serine protease Do
MNKIKDFLKKHFLLTIIIICLILGIGGGFIGEIIAMNYFIGSPYGLLSLGNIDFSQGKFSDQGFVISNAKNVIVQQDAKVDETVKSVANSLVGIYKKQKTAKAVTAFSLDNFYKLSDAVGQGFIITSDGWIVTAMALDKNYADYVVMTQDKKIYPIDAAASDNLTDLNFIHVAARDFSVRKIADLAEIKQGNLTVGVDWFGLGWVSSIEGWSEKNALIKSSDNFSRKLVLNQDVPKEFKGSVIFNLAGDGLGMLNIKGEIEPLAYLTSAANSLFRNKIIKRPSLGANYINLTELAAIDAANDGWQKGVIIYRDQKGLAVQKNGPADKAGLKEGDIIVSVDNISLDNSNDLAEIIQNYAAGDRITLLIRRNGSEKEVQVVLGEQK